MSIISEIDEIRLLTSVVRNGWNNKKIFVEPKQHHKNSLFTHEINPGWNSVLISLNDKFPLPGYLSVGECGPSPKSILSLLTEAEGVLKIFNQKVFSEEDLLNDIASIHYDTLTSHDSAKSILKLLREKYMLL